MQLCITSRTRVDFTAESRNMVFFSSDIEKNSMIGKTFKGKIAAQGMEITVLSRGNDGDFINLTDIARYKNTEFSSDAVKVVP